MDARQRGNINIGEMLSERCLKIHFILNNCAGWGREGTFRVANCRLGRIFAAFSNAILGACSQPPDGQMDGRTGGAGRCGGALPLEPPAPAPLRPPPPLLPARDARCGAESGAAGRGVGEWVRGGAAACPAVSPSAFALVLG